MCKRLYFIQKTFDYFDKSLIVLSAASSSISIASFTTVIGTPVKIVSAGFSLTFSLSTGLVKKCQKQQEIKRKSITKLLC